MSSAPGAAGWGDGVLSIAHCIARPEDRTCTVVLSDGRHFELAASAPELEFAVAGRRVDVALFGQLEHAAERRRLARRVFALLNRRPTTRARLREKLLTETQDTMALDAVLAEFEAQGLVDDRAFAAQFVEDQLRARCIGPLSLLQRLGVQGVPPQAAQAAVRELLPHERECEVAQRAIERRAGWASDKSPQAKARARRFLRARGFRAAAIAAALSQSFASRTAKDGESID